MIHNFSEFYLRWGLVRCTRLRTLSIFDDPVTNLLSLLRTLIEIFSCAHPKGGKGLNNFKCGTFIGRF